jgi:arginine/lysine/ornithine decarboxylase
MRATRSVSASGEFTSRQALAITSMPPPTRTMDSEMPKKLSSTLPATMATISIRQTLMATRLASTIRVDDDAPSVSDRKIGAIAGGFRKGSRVASAKKKLVPKTRR